MLHKGLSCSVAQSCLTRLFAIPWTAACQTSLSFTISQKGLRKNIKKKKVMEKIEKHKLDEMGALNMK